ncbi:MAG: glycosyltransferase family 39 protein [Terriglobia bacterium]|nr:glycosyltransferase family 39 protein [Terriglobia bacterium]
MTQSCEGKQVNDIAALRDSLPPLPDLRAAVQLALIFATVKLSVHIFANWLAPHLGYGLFRDELYFIDCGRRLAWGYVDQAPMVALQARVAEILFGHSLIGLRLFSAMAGSATVFLTGMLVWALAGPPVAQAIGMTAVLFSPFYLAFGDYLSMNSFEPVFWMTIALVAIMLARGANPRWWLIIGLACGLGIENKQDIVFFMAALLTGLLVSPQRKLLVNRWVLVAIAITVVIALPNLIWQIRNDWPTWQFLRNPQRPIIHHHFLGFVLQQLLFMNITWMLAGVGLLWLLFSTPARKFRFLAFGYILFFFLMFALHASTYYLGPHYPILIAAGAIAWEASTRNRRWALVAVVSLMVAYDVIYIPMSIPLQRPAAFLRYRNAVMRFTNPFSQADDETIGQWYSDKIGWPEMVRDVAEAYDSLPPNEQARTAILSQFYGDASAIDILGARYGLPNAVSGNQNFWLWGPRGYDGEYVIAVGYSRDEIPNVFGSVQQVGQVYSRYATAYENRPIFLCKDMYPPLRQYWPHLKNWR